MGKDQHDTQVKASSGGHKRGGGGGADLFVCLFVFPRVVCRDCLVCLSVNLFQFCLIESISTVVCGNCFVSLV